jgi:hypothetical protein
MGESLKERVGFGELVAIEGLKMYQDSTATLIVREKAVWGKQIGLQSVMQKVVAHFPTSVMRVRVLFSTYAGKPLKRDYHINNGEYCPVGRKVTNWRDKDGKKTSSVYPATV